MAKSKKPNPAQIVQARSLVQLKHLNDISSITDRLALAASLCNHTHRADMIFRWLADLMKAEAPIRQLPQAWDLLTQAGRLLSDPRLGLLIRNHHVVKYIELALKEGHSDLATGLLPSVSRLFAFLLNRGTSGPLATTSILFLSATEAASLYEAIISIVVLQLDQQVLSTEESVTFIGDALDIWAARKTSPDEDSLFQTHCWWSSAELYSRLRLYPDLLRSSKRKRSSLESHAWSLSSCASHLERLIATHVFVPSRRKVFSQLSDSAQHGTLLDADSPFATQLQSSVNSNQESWDSVPLQLEIAYRCTSMVTHRQRSQELPWVNTIFTAFLDLWIELDGPRNSRQTLLHMLEKVIERGVSLSQSCLARIIDEFGNLGSPECEWTLVAKVVQLGASFFAEEPRTTQLLSTIRIEPSFRGTATEQLDLATLVNGDILYPTCKAYADKHGLFDFLAIWHKQLVLDVPAIWMTSLHLDDILAQLFEGSSTTHQLGREVAGRVQEITDLKDALLKTGDSQEFSHFSASAIILATLLNGISLVASEDIVAASAGALLEAFLDLIRNTSSKLITISRLVAVWEPARLAFRLWFSQFALRESYETVAAKAKSLLQEPLLKLAAVSAHKYSAEGEANLNARLGHHGSMHFVAHLCDSLHAYDDCADLASGLFAEVFDPLDTVAISMLHAHPALVKLLPSKLQPGIFDQKWSTGANDAERIKLTRAASAIDVPGFLSLTLGKLTEVPDVDSNAFTASEFQDAIALLLAMPVSSFAKHHKQQVVDICITDKIQRKHNLEDYLGRIALLVKMSQAAVNTSLLTDDQRALWALCHDIDLADLLPEDLLNLTESLGTLTDRTCRHLITTAPPAERLEQIQKCFVASTKALGSSLQHATRQTRLTAITIAASTLCVVVDFLVRSQDGRNVGQFSTVSNALLGQINLRTNAVLTKDLDELSADAVAMLSLISYLEAAKALSRCLGPSMNRNAAFLELKDLASKVMTKYTPEPWDEAQGHGPRLVLISPAISAYQVLCLDNADPALLAHSACRILSVPFSARDRSRIIRAYQESIGSLDSPTKLAVAQGLLDANENEPRPTTFVVLRATLSALTDAGRGSLSDHPAILATVLKQIRSEPRFAVVKAALGTVDHLLRHNTSLVNQYEIDLTLSTIHALAKPAATETLIYSDLCNVMVTLLTHHRARLNGRFHLVITVLQAQLTQLLTPRSSTRHQAVQALSERHAQAYARIITLVCEPPASYRKKKKIQHNEAGDLVDQDRRNRAHVGSFVHSILHAYCRLVLRSPPSESIRQALLPAIAAILGAMHIYSSDSIKVLSSAITDSERAILRGLVEVWRITSKWNGI